MRDIEQNLVSYILDNNYKTTPHLSFSRVKVALISVVSDAPSAAQTLIQTHNPFSRKWFRRFCANYGFTYKHDINKILEEKAAAVGVDDVHAPAAGTKA